ncbi:Na/Pi cotransporter family protein [Clostridium sp. D2Q-11]|uniref:Na/Pi cotransporter family protein n=1 Tax=Anaeromonas frigoriresistens TaxID=2683708 RepID=A0A942UX78_9FIRM|nr:Na/Pi symporter [Anaeromonas frigoriresistens]MBS4539230.1 Na/Pi cotransporter family protein [Anaeromonas frigoriresistens]
MEIFYNDNLKILIEFISGLIVFLFSIRLLSLTLEENISFKWKTLIERFTSMRINGLILGIVVTALLQSSSLVIIIIITLVHSRLINVNKAIPLILGSNIGTTFTGQLTAFNINSLLSYLIILGIVLYLYTTNYHIQITSIFILSIALIFIGIELMGGSVASFTNSPELLKYVYYIYDSNFNGVIFGAAFSALIHSSSTSVVLLQLIAKSGMIPLISAIYILFGLNIGTCIDAVIGGIATNSYGKRIALFHVLFNILGVLVFFYLGNILAKVVVYISPNNIPRQIANAHTIFNVIMALLVLPFTYNISCFLKKVIR